MPLDGLIPIHIDKYDKSNIIKAPMMYIYEQHGQKTELKFKISIWKKK